MQYFQHSFNVIFQAVCSREEEIFITFHKLEIWFVSILFVNKYDSKTSYSFPII